MENLEAARAEASIAYRAAKKAFDRKPTAANQARHDAALAALRVANKAAWDATMANCTIVNWAGA